MANYKEHRSTSLGWWLVVSLLLLLGRSRLGLSEGDVLIMIAVGLPSSLLGAGFPDIDLASSIPHRRFRLLLFFSIAALSLRPLFSDKALQVITAALTELKFSASFAPVGAVLLALISGAVAVAILAVLLPRHRGITHRWPLGLSVASLLGLLVYAALLTFAQSSRVAVIAAVASSAFFAVGFASHLFKDGLLLGRKRR